MKKMTLLGGLTPAQFMRDYWHKKPLLIRGAVPDFSPLLSREKLFEMATQEEVESRLISYVRKQWKMASGPLTTMPATSQSRWTLLVQGVNLHDPAAEKLLRQFRFLPDARLDDLMISYATDGGGVGPHYDSYDVFLLQAHGKRRWRIGAQQDLSLVPGVPLKILQNFEPEQEFVLEPGDMLYLPPNFAHDGVAVGECMTYSIGFRAPSYQELGEGFLTFLTDTVDLPGRYGDPDLKPSSRPAEIGSAMLDDVTAQMNRIRFDREDVAIFLGEYLSEPKASVFFTAPVRAASLQRFTTSSVRRGITLDAKTRMLYRGKLVFVNGESFTAGKPDAQLLSILANQRALEGAALEGASEDLMQTLHAWYLHGWIRSK